MDRDDPGAGPSGLQAQHVRSETASNADQCQQRKKRGPNVDHDDKILSPKKKRTKQTPLRAAEKRTVINIYKDVKGSRPEGSPAYRTQLINRTAEIAGHTKSKVWQDNTIKSSKEAHRAGLSSGLKNPTGKGRRLIIGHIGSTDGFVMDGELIFEAKKGDGDYHSEMDAHNFEKWFKLILSKIESGAVIVMDNAPYHSRKLEKLPTTATRKADIQEWLKNKNIPFEEKDLRATLLEKVRRIKHFYQKFAVDEMAKEKEVLVLRLPPYHCELNPIELVWAQMKGYVAQNNKSFKLQEVKQLLPQALLNITAEKWQSCIAHTIKEEERFCQLDGIMDDVVEKFIINVGETSSSSSDDDE